MGHVKVKQNFAKPIKLADQITKSADDVQSLKEDCLELKSKTEKLAALLRQAAQASSDLYERTTLQTIDRTEKVLYKSLSLVQKCRSINGLMKLILTITPAKCFPSDLFTISIPPTTFKEVVVELQILIGDVSRLLHLYVSSRSDRMAIRFDSIAQNELIFCLIWEEFHTLCEGSIDNRSDAATHLVSLAHANNDRYRKSIIQETGVGPLLKLVEERHMIHGAQAIHGDAQSLQHMIHGGVCDVFKKILKDEGPIKVQPTMGWAVSELVPNDPKYNDHFALNYAIQLLVNDLAFEYEDDPATKASMAAKALRHLAKGNSAICRIITESGGLVHFAVLLEKCPDVKVQFDSAMALMEIAAVAEEDTELRWSAFHPDTPAAKAVFEQLLRIIEQADSYSHLLIPCVMTIGYLARTITATATRIIGLLVKLFEVEGGRDVVIAAAIALSNFACTRNPSHLKHCKAIISEGGVKYLAQLVYHGWQTLQISALIPLSYIALHFPESEELARMRVLKVLEKASTQDNIIRNPIIYSLLSEAKSRLELYQNGGTRPIVG